MNTTDSVLERAKTKVQKKVQATVPVDRQVKAAHLVEKAKRLVGMGEPLVLTERPIPDAADVPLTELDVSNPFLNRQGKWYEYFERLREEAPVHYLADSPFGPFWSITRYADIQAVDTNPEVFSAERHADMPLVTAVADRLVALDLGRVIAEGTSAEVLADPALLGLGDLLLDRLCLLLELVEQVTVHRMAGRPFHRAPVPAGRHQRLVARRHGDALGPKLRAVAGLEPLAAQVHTALTPVHSVTPDITLPTSEAKEWEPQFAAAGYAVVTNTSVFRMTPNVPLLIPEVNPDHTCLIPTQQAENTHQTQGLHTQARHLGIDLRKAFADPANLAVFAGCHDRCKPAAAHHQSLRLGVVEAERAGLDELELAGDEVEERGVRLVADRRHDRRTRCVDRTDQALVGEGQQVLDAAAAAGDDDDVDLGVGLEGLGDLAVDAVLAERADDDRDLVDFRHRPKRPQTLFGWRAPDRTAATATPSRFSPAL